MRAHQPQFRAELGQAEVRMLDADKELLGLWEKVVGSFLSFSRKRVSSSLSVASVAVACLPPRPLMWKCLAQCLGEKGP